MVNNNELWTEQEDDVVRAVYRREGTAGVMRRLPRRTRMSVVGRAKRLGIKFAKPERPAKPVRSRVEPRYYPRAAPTLVVQEIFSGVRQLELSLDGSSVPVSRRKKLDDDLSPRQCRWIYGDTKSDPDWHFCDSRKVKDSSYCAKHSALAKNPHK